uniref:DUF4228 domain protein n=1 Tax=Zea mays TaxID=4577 RepID=A0A804LFM3_MAIZE
MGNCQAAETATVLIQHPGGGRTERAYWALSAGAVMAANPGHYVAAVITVPQPGGAGDDGAASASAAAPVKHLKLLRPDDTLLLGRVYRLVSFEEVLREFASKRHVKLSRVTVRAKDEGEDVKPAPKHRRRRASGGGERKESERSLAKVPRVPPFFMDFRPQSPTTDLITSPHVPRLISRAHSLRFPSIQVMGQTEEQLVPEAGPASGPAPSSSKQGDADTPAGLDADLEALLQPHGALLGRRAGRQWRPALQSIAEGEG